MGKETSSGFEETGQSNQPPTRILTAVTKLKSDHQLGRSNIPDYLSSLPESFVRPMASDRLFESTYSHDMTGTNDNCEQCDVNYLVDRKERKTKNPNIFYGTIASGNTVAKNGGPGSLRDTLRRRHNVLCFEMEAAGLMNDFPCIVVRGICDYCDSHKNKDWQNYAAAAAAAWAKELLQTVSPDVVTSLPFLTKGSCGAGCSI